MAEGLTKAAQAWLELLMRPRETLTEWEAKDRKHAENFLTIGQKRLLRLRYGQGLEEKEMAVLLKKSPEALQKCLGNARARLQKLAAEPLRRPPENRRCRSCGYGLGQGESCTCGYFDVTGLRRGCSVQACTRYAPKTEETVRRNRNVLLAHELLYSKERLLLREEEGLC